MGQIEREGPGIVMTRDPKLVVAHGYDVIAGTYLEHHGQSVVRDRWLREMSARLPEAARVLDLGCGAGVPVAHRLTERGLDVVGVDGSIEQIKLVPGIRVE